MITFREVAHLYVGCEAIYGGYGQDEKVRINAADMKHDKLEFSFMDRDHKDDGDVHSWFKPILRSLEDISEAECREIFAMNHHSGCTWEDYTATAADYLRNNCREFWWLKQQSLNPRAKTSLIGNPVVWLYLLNHQYDLFHLIPNSHAIRKEQK